MELRGEGGSIRNEDYDVTQIGGPQGVDRRIASSKLGHLGTVASCVSFFYHHARLCGTGTLRFHGHMYTAGRPSSHDI